MKIEVIFKELMSFFHEPKLQPKPKPKSKPPIQVVIDAGHGGYDLGLNTRVKGKKTPNKGINGIMEKDINLEMATRLGWLCARHDLGYILTRWGDRYISLGERCRIANNAKVGLFLSIHCNYSPTFSKIRGIETYHFKGSQKSKEMAQIFQKSLISLDYSLNRGVLGHKFKVLRDTKMPSVLVELGFLSNPGDAKFLNNTNNQERVAYALFEGLRKIFL